MAVEVNLAFTSIYDSLFLSTLRYLRDQTQQALHRHQKTSPQVQQRIRTIHNNEDITLKERKYL